MQYFSITRKIRWFDTAACSREGYNHKLVCLPLAPKEDRSKGGDAPVGLQPWGQEIYPLQTNSNLPSTCVAPALLWSIPLLVPFVRNEQSNKQHLYKLF